MTDITGMSITLTAGTWLFEAILNGNKASVTTGAQFALNYTGSTTSYSATQIAQASTTTWVATAKITAINTASTTSWTTAGAQCQARLSGQIVVSNGGNLVGRVLSVTSGTVTIDNSSYLYAIKVA